MKRCVCMMALLAAMVAGAGYEQDMGKTYGSSTAVAWQAANKDAIAAATAPEALAAAVKDAASAAALLAQVRPAYATDPLTATQIAAVTQYVMEDDGNNGLLARLAFWRTTRADKRALWAKALLAAAQRADDPTVTVFLLDQLRWCGLSEQALAVEFLAASRDAHVRQMATLVATELRR